MELLFLLLIELYVYIRLCLYSVLNIIVSSMARLPIPGSDDGTWGNLLNDFLQVEHNPDGTLKASGTLAGKAAATHAATHGSAGSDPVTPSAIGAVTTSGGGRETTGTQTATGVNTTVTLANGNVQQLTLGASTTISLTGAAAGVACSLSLYIIQDGVGSRTITWPASIKWPGGVAPSLSTAAGKIDLIVLETLDGGTVWFGARAGADYR